jgi:hypothetical protein
MAKNYRLLTESIRARINPDNVAIQKAYSDELSTLSYSDVLTYIRVAMKSVEPEYTQKSKEAGEKVKEHLSKQLINVVYKYQGSVMTNTHIKGYSDIDLLTICDKFYTHDLNSIKELLNTNDKRAKYSQSSIEKLEREVNITSYSGNSLDDLKNLRLDSEKILSSVYSVCDIKNPKAIKITNLSLKRDVDIATANWYDDVTSVINDKGDYRGIQIYNKEKNQKEKADYPFLSINRINERSSSTNGRLKKMIRFLKNTKANSDHDIDLSSFDINAICYDIDPVKYQNLTIFQLVPLLYLQLKSICTSQEHSDSIISVDGREYIFRGNTAKLNNVKSLLGEVEGIYLDFLKQNIL